MMYARLHELTNQLVYLQDTTNIILSDVGSMQSNIEKTLKEEASMVESYSMDIVDMDFLRRHYQVDVTVIPKEYTKATKVSVYFGTIECPLKLEGYAYKGSVILSLDKSFEGNVTFLLANGKKKTTEVLEHYDGLKTNLDQVLTGKLDEAPVCREGTLRLKTDCNFTLDGGDRYRFNSLDLIVKLDTKQIWKKDLLETLRNKTPEEALEQKDGEQLQTTEQQEETSPQLPIDQYSSIESCDMSFELDPEEETGTKHIRVFLRAISSEGYRFEYDVFQGDYDATQGKMNKESFDWTSHSMVYDKKGGALELE